MDDGTFDRLTLLLGRLTSRRATVGGLGASGLAMAMGRSAFEAAAKKKRKKRKRKKVTFNEFGCVNVGSFCQTSDQCCSGICEGRKGKKRCQAHDAGTGCQAGQASGCGGAIIHCTTSTGFPNGECVTTTGNAAYCVYGFVCADCRTDVDCQELCGVPEAACVRCPNCDSTPTYATGCVGPSKFDCLLPE